MIDTKPQKPKWETERGWQKMYGRWWGPARDAKGKPVRPAMLHEIEGAAFMQCMGWAEGNPPPPLESPGEWKETSGMIYTAEDGSEIKIPPSRVHTGAVHHFMKLCDCFFSDPNCGFYFQWNPWAVQLLEDKILYRRYSVAGPASSGKSRFGALWAVMNWFLHPRKTKVLVSSTNKASAKGRIWGDVTNCYQRIIQCMDGINMPVPAKWLTAQDKIIFRHGKLIDTKAGIELIPGSESEESETAGKLQGYKQERIFFVADEFATIGRGIWNTVKSNLFKNPMVDFIGLFNPGSYYDVAGCFCRPMHSHGWDSITLDTECWMGAEGFVRRLDGEKSPNARILIKDAKWKGLISMDMIADDAERYGGRNTSDFWRMVRGAWPPAGVVDTIFTESEFDKWQGGQTEKDIRWMEPPIPVCGFDPAFVHGGDLAAAAFGLCGWVMDEVTKARKKVLVITQIVILADDVHAKGSKIDQVLRHLVDECRKRKVDPRHVAIDESGNIAVSSLLAREWSNDFLRVQFQSRASDAPISLDNPTPAHEEYANRASELWYSLKPLLRAGQFKVGNQPEVIREMSLRTYKRKGDKIIIESKEDMKLRLNGKSPDRGDAVALCADLCRQRLGLSSKEKPAKFNRPQTILTGAQQYLQGTGRRQPLFDYGQPLKTGNSPKWS